MITLATAETLAAWGDVTEAAVKVGGLFRAYGAAVPFLRFYTDEHGAFASVMDGTAVLAAPANGLYDREEWAWFLAAGAEIRCVRSNAETAALLTAFPVKKSGVVMAAPAGVSSVGETASLTPRELYGVIQEAFCEEAPAFEGFYVDVSHRMRHGCCRTAGVIQDGIPVSAALTVAETADAAVIGGVATRSLYRRNGYAHACVTALTEALQNEKKTVLIAPRDTQAERLYANWGFSATGTWGEATR